MLQIASRFQLDSAPVSACKYGNGHINTTYLVTTQSGRNYILQKLNTQIFQDVVGLMRNISSVTKFLAERDSDPRHVLHIVPTTEGKLWAELEEGVFRVYDFIPGGVCLNLVETPDDFKQSGIAFGEFQKKLSEFPADTLTETIPRFHDTPNRMRLFHKALEADALGRAKEVRPEIDFVLAREQEASTMMNMLHNGELPLRVTHNDTKLNNVMLDEKTRKPLCILDLDTIMPGLVGNDFGDSIRFGASTALEDERNLDLVHFSLPLYRAYAEGFLSACDALTPSELETLPLSCRLMTLEVGLRFLTDYLEGDVYFHTSRPGHNLDRCRTQLKLVSEMETQDDQMHQVIAEITTAGGK